MATATIPLGMLGGVNLHDDPLALKEDEAQWLENLWPTKPGVLSKRKSMQWADVLADIFTDGSASGKYMFAGTAMRGGFEGVRDFHFLPRVPDAIYMAHVYGPAEEGAGYGTAAENAGGYDTDTHKLIIRTTNNMTTPIELGEVANRVFFLDYGEATLVLTGGGTPMVVGPNFPSYHRAIAWDFAGASAPPDFRPTCACVYQDRVVYGCRNYIAFSDKLVPETVGGRYELFDPNEVVTALVPVATGVESVENFDAFVILTNKGAYLVRDAPGETFNDLNAFPFPNPSRLPEASDCISHATVAQTKFGVVWCGSEDVWAMRIGGKPERVGTKIRARVEALAPELRWKAHAAYDGEAYVLALPSDDQAVTASGPLHHHWKLDIRNGLPQEWTGAKWFGPQVYRALASWDVDGEGKGTTCLRRRESTAADDRKVYSLIPIRTIQRADGSTPEEVDYCIGVQLVTFDGEEAVDSVYPRLPKPIASQLRLPSTAYVAGDTIIVGEYMWTCQVAGTTSATATEDVAELQPMPQSGGNAFTDGTVTWYPFMQMYDDFETVLFGPSAGDTFYNYTGGIGHLSDARIGEYLVRPTWVTREVTLQEALTDKRVDCIELAYSSNRPTRLEYMYYPNVEIYDGSDAGAPAFPGSQRDLKAPGYINLLESTDVIGGVAGLASMDVRRLSRDILAHPPLKRRASQSVWARVQEMSAHNNTSPGIFIDSTNNFILAVGWGYDANLFETRAFVAARQLDDGWQLLSDINQDMAILLTSLATEMQTHYSATIGSGPTYIEIQNNVDDYEPGALNAIAPGGVNRQRCVFRSSNAALIAGLAEVSIHPGWIDDTFMGDPLSIDAEWQTYKARHRRIAGIMGWLPGIAGISSVGATSVTVTAPVPPANANPIKLDIMQQNLRVVPYKRRTRNG